MSKIHRLLAGLVVASLSFVACDDDSSTSAAPTPHPDTLSGEPCTGYQGTWALDSFVVQKSGDTTLFRYEYLFAPNSFRLRMVQEGFTGKIDLVVKKDTGSLRDLGGNRLLVTPTASWAYDWKDTTLKAASVSAPDTISYRNSGEGRLVLEGLRAAEGASVTLFCR